MEDREPRADLVGEGEEVELDAQSPVVAAFGFREPVQVRLEVLVARPGRAVDAGELLVVLVASPVRTGHVRQLERPEHAGVRHVRPHAQVDPRVVGVQGDGLAGRRLLVALTVTVALTRADALDDLDLVRLVAQPLDGFLARDLLAHEALVPLHDLAHAPVDLREVGGVHGLWQVEVVIEAIGDRGADRVLRTRVEIAHRLGEHVGGRVPQHVQPVVGCRRDGLDIDVGVGGRHVGQVAQLAVDAGGDRALRQGGADRFPFGKLDRRGVGQGQRRHPGMIATVPVATRTRSPRAR